MILLLIVISFFVIYDYFSNFKKNPTGYNLNYSCPSVIDFNKQNNIYSHIRELKPSSKIYLPKYDISNSQIKYILSKIVNSDKNNLFKIDNSFKELHSLSYDYYTGFKKSYFNKSDILKIINNVVNKINEHMIRLNYNLGPNYGLFTIMSYYLINLSSNKNGDNKFVINLVIYRLNKYYGFEIQLSCILTKNKDIIITELYLFGNIINEKFSQIKPFTKYNTININDNFPLIKNTNSNMYYRLSTDHQIKLSNNKDLLNKNKNINELIDYRKYKCYINNSKLPLDRCQSKFNLEKKKYNKQGVWDKICEKDSECPFYKANKNYPNSFGGCVNYKCQLPINMKNISPHFFDYNEQNKPFCYNCKDTYRCCDKQMNKKMYPKLITPDYAFPNDYLIRMKYKNILKKKNLFPNKYIVKTNSS